MKYQMEYDEISNKIVTDEEVDENERCWDYRFASDKGSGFGVIATSREICIKKIKNVLKDEIKEVKKELALKQKAFRKLEGVLDEERNKNSWFTYR